MTTVRHLWPRLAGSRVLATSDGAAPDELRELRLGSALDDPAAAPAPSGGPVVPAARIADVRDAVRAVADDQGWPEPLSSTGDGTGGRDRVETFDRRCAVALHEGMAIIPADAAHAGVWDFLAVVVLPDVARWRAAADDGLRRPGPRHHVVGRLWWRVEVFGPDLVEPDGSLPPTAAELQVFADHPALEANPAIARRLVTAVLGEPPDRRGAVLADAGRRTLRLMPSVCLDALPPAALDARIDELVARSIDAAERSLD